MNVCAILMRSGRDGKRHPRLAGLYRPGPALLAVEPYSAVLNTYTVPFRGGLLIYVVPPGKRVVGMVDMVGVQR